jgi:predicted adenine nucleotide alpha hydrolase (AANH) superfamily ATPase
MIESFNTSLANISDQKEKQRLQALHTEKLKRTELTIWLKDFPKTSADLKEIRRSAA